MFRIAVVCGCALSLAVSNASAQCEGVITLQRTVVSPITNFDFGQFDLTGSGAGPTLFTLKLSSPCPSDSYYLELIIEVNSNVVNGEVYAGHTQHFAIPAGGGLFLTSNQLFNSGADPNMPSFRTDRALEEKNVQDLLLGSGVVPSGMVVFKFKLYHVQTGAWVVPANDVVIQIANIRYLSLVAPGVNPALAGGYVPEVFAPYPQFIWFSDLVAINYGGNIVKFVVSVFENPDGQFAISDIPGTKPLWTAEVFNANFAQYPVSGVKPLVPGRVYYWQVEGILRGPNERRLKSELFAFKVGDFSFMPNLTPTQKEILACLEAILGENFPYLLDDIRNLIPEDKVNLNGQEIALDDLGEVARQFKLKKWRIRKVAFQ